MTVKVYIENLQDKIKYTQKIDELIEKTVNEALNTMGFDIDSEISVMLVDDNEIREINKNHREIDKSTDVLSFPMVDMYEGEVESYQGDIDFEENLLILGDIIVSLETAKRQSEEYGHSLERELAFLITHGVLHLLGFDHEEKEMESRMFSKQEEILEKLGLVRG